MKTTACIKDEMEIKWMRKIKILQIGCENFGAGGRSVIIFNLTRYASADFRIDFFSSAEVKNEEFVKEIEAQGGKIKVYIENTAVNKITRELLRARAISKMMREENYDIVHINADDAWEAAKSELYARYAGIKTVIVHGHSVGAVHGFGFLKKMVIFFSKLYVKKDADQKIACSFQAAEYLFGKNMLENVLILKNGINVERFLFNQKSREKIRKELEISDGHIVIGCVGRMSREKNPLFMLEVMRWITSANKKVVMIWVGDGKLRTDMIEKITELHLEENVKLMGNRNDVNEIFQAMDIFVLPSEYEGFGIVNLEAQASGLPCVVSEGVPEVAKVNDNFYRIALEKGEKYWADFVLSKIGDRVGSGIMERFQKSGYDISYSSECLMKCYEDLIK